MSIRRTAALLALLALTACGSTVGPQAGRLATGTDEFGTPAAEHAGAGEDQIVAAGPDTPLAAGRAGATKSTTGPTIGASAAASAARDTTPIKVGVLHVEGGNAVISAGFGNTPVAFGDGRVEAQAVADDVNKRGGANGRKLELAFGAVQATSADGPGIQAACENLVQDHKVFVILSIFNVRSLLVDCAAKHKVLLMATALGGGDDTLYRNYRDYLFTPTQLSLDREQRLVIDVGRDAGKLARGTKVGVVIQDDDPMYNRVYERSIVPSLKALGITPVPAHIASAGSAGDISNAVLRFATENVTQVLFSAGNGGIPIVLFMQTAEQQQFRPGYILGDSSDTWFVGSQAPVNQRRNIFGAGTYPIANVRTDQYPTTPREQNCLNVITNGGQRVSDRHSSLTATFYCELVYGFAAVAARVPGKLTNELWRAAYYGFGREYPAITSFASDLANGRNDNPDLYRVLGYKESCQCISYLSDSRRLEIL